MAWKLNITVLLTALALVACQQSTPQPLDQPEVGDSDSALIGQNGGQLEVGAARVMIPADAVAQETQVEMLVTGDATPSAFAAFSPLYRFEPAGMVFDEPITVRLPFDGDPESATIFWTSHSNGSFVALPTTVVDGFATAQVRHFSSAFVGSACAEGECCDSANGELDVVLMIDNSNSMQEEQAALAEQIPRMARVLATGDLDGDGEQDFPALQSVRVGVVTSDMGTGGYTIQTCDDPIDGDDGVLQTEGRLEGCEASYPSYAEFSADDDDAALEGFVHQVECVAVAGLEGCGFEQQLESVLKATTEHASGANADFLREDSLVAFVMLTDESDCSAANPDLFNPQNDELGPLNVRCGINPDELYPVDRYIDGLQGLRADPADVIFSVVAGVPVDLVGSDVETILADERMTPTINPENPNEIMTSCESVTGRAYPPRRMVEVAQGFGGNGVVQSICQEDFSGVIGAILERVAARASGECL